MSLQQIKQKIKTSESTVKITKVMQMVATAKLQRMKPIIVNSRIYKDNVLSILSNIIDKHSNKSIFKNHDTKQKIAMIITFSSDKGLCGNLNIGLCKHVIENIIKLKSQGFAIKMKHIGNKAHTTFAYKIKDDSISQEYLSGFYHHGKIDIKAIDDLSKQLIQGHIDGDFTDLFIAFNDYKTIVSSNFNFIDVKHYISEIVPNQTPYELDCDAEIISKFSEYQALFAILGFAINSNLTCEHSFRMQAMDNATRNTNKLIQELTKVFNKTRQAEITRNLIDIVSGSESIAS